MKVNNTGVKSTSVAQANSKEIEKGLTTKNKGDAQEALATLGSTNVKMSPEAHAFQKAKAIASDNSVDEAKVARLQKLIDSGKYRVDAEAVADRLVDEHLSVGE